MLGKEENAVNQHFLLFPPCFLHFPKQISIFSHTFIMSSASPFNLDQSKILLFGRVNPFPNKPWFLHVCSTNHFKHCGKKRNCLLRAISLLLAMFSTSLENLLPFLTNLKLSSANSFSLEESKICRLGKG